METSFFISTAALQRLAPWSARHEEALLAAPRDLHEAYRPAAAEDRRRAGARLFYDGGDGQGFRLSRQGNRSAAGDATACGRVMNGHASMVVPTKNKINAGPPVEGFTINSCG